MAGGGVLHERKTNIVQEAEHDEEKKIIKNVSNNKFQTKIKYFNVLWMSGIHFAAFYGFFLFMTSCKLQTMVTWYFASIISGK